MAEATTPVALSEVERLALAGTTRDVLHELGAQPGDEAEMLATVELMLVAARLRQALAAGEDVPVGMILPLRDWIAQERDELVDMLEHDGERADNRQRVEGCEALLARLDARDVRLSDEESAVVAEAVERASNEFSDGMGPVAGVADAQELWTAAARITAFARLAQFGKHGGFVDDELLAMLGDAETSYVECVAGDRDDLERVTAAVDPEGYCWEGQTLDDVRRMAAEQLSTSERQLAAIRSILGRAQTGQEVAS